MKIPHGSLVMAIDGEKMLMLRNEGDEKFLVLETLGRQDLDNPPTRDQGSDAPGRTLTSSNAGRSAYGQTDWHRQSEERFALAGVERLERVAAESECDVVVVAPPRTLGVMRDHWSSAMQRRIVAQIGKDLVHHETDDIARAIADYKAQ